MRRRRVSLMFSLQYAVFSDLLRYRPRDPFVLNDEKTKMLVMVTSPMRLFYNRSQISLSCKLKLHVWVTKECQYCANIAQIAFL